MKGSHQIEFFVGLLVRQAGSEDPRVASDVQAPKEYSNWTVRLLARVVVAFEIIEAINHETVRGVLKNRHDQAKDRVLGDPA